MCSITESYSAYIREEMSRYSLPIEELAGLDRVADIFSDPFIEFSSPDDVARHFHPANIAAKLKGWTEGRDVYYYCDATNTPAVITADDLCVMAATVMEHGIRCTFSGIPADTALDIVRNVWDNMEAARGVIT